MSPLEPRSDTTTPRGGAPLRAAALVLALASQLAALLHPCGAASIAHADSIPAPATVEPRERAELPSPRDSARVSDHALAARWNALLLAARDTTTSKSGPALRDARDLALFENPTYSRRARWFLWATSAVAVGAVIAVFAQPQDVAHAGRPDLPAFPDAP